MSARLAEICDQVKVDVLSKNPAQDNAAKRKEIARSFICTSIVCELRRSHGLIDDYLLQLTL